MCSHFKIYFITCKLKKLSKNKANDLKDIGIALEIVPVVMKDQTFDYNKFYGVSCFLS